eukprot:m.126793 g.126793  ORF g.126793 m.126793 type:complete len:992 (+) comp9400_c0_seq1:328-3303(+)
MIVLVLLAGLLMPGSAFDLCGTGAVEPVVNSSALRALSPDLIAGLACAFNTTETFRLLLCNDTGLCSSAQRYADCLAAAMAGTTPSAAVLGFVRVSLDEVIRTTGCTFNIAPPLQALLNSSLVPPPLAMPAQPISSGDGNDTCTFLAGTDVYSLFAISGAFRPSHPGVFLPDSATLSTKLRVTLCPGVWGGPACSSEQAVVCQEVQYPAGAYDDSSLGTTLTGAFQSPAGLTLFFQDRTVDPVLLQAVGSVATAVTPRFSSEIDLILTRSVLSLVSGWLAAAATDVSVRTAVTFACDPAVTGEPVITNFQTLAVRSNYDQYALTIVHRCACPNTYCVPPSSSSPSCDGYSILVPDAYYWVGLAFVIIMILVERRSTFHPEILRGVGGVPIPFNYLEDRLNTGSTALIFCCFSVMLFQLMTNGGWAAPTPYLSTVYAFAYSLQQSFLVFALFLCNHCRIPLLGYVFGALFTLGLCIYFTLGAACSFAQLDNQDSGEFVVACIFVYILLVYFVTQIALKLRHLLTGASLVSLTTRNVLGKLDFYERRVRQLLQPAHRRYNKIDGLGFRESKVQRRVYWARGAIESLYSTWILQADWFRYNGRIVSAIAVSAIVVLLNMLVMIDLTEYFQAFAGEMLQPKEDPYCLTSDRTAFASQTANGLIPVALTCNETLFIARSVAVCFIVSTLLATMLQLWSLRAMALSYRHHLLRLHAGDRSFLPETTPAPAAILVNALRFGAFLIGYTFSGFFAIVVILLILTLFINFLAVLPLYGYYGTGFWTFLGQQLPAIVIAISFFFLQIYIVKYIFLQRPGQADLGLRRRAWFHNYDYFLFVFNVLSAVVSYILRFVLSTALVIAYFSRLDKTMFLQGWHWFDPGYRTYLAFLLVDAYYANPTMITFVRILCPATSVPSRIVSADKEMSMKLLSGSDDVIELSRRRARLRWALAYTLLHNPDLKKDRRAHAHGTSTWYADVASENMRTEAALEGAQEVLSGLF